MTNQMGQLDQVQGLSLVTVHWVAVFRSGHILKLYLCWTILSEPLRYAMLVEDGVVKKVNVEPDGTGLTCSLATNILSDLA